MCICQQKNTVPEKCTAQKGSVLIYLVAVIVVAGVLGAGIVSLTTSSTFTQLSHNPSEEARYLAKAGLEYAQSQEVQQGKYIISDDPEKKFHVSENNGVIEVIATVYKGTHREARFKTRGRKDDGQIIIIDDEGNRIEEEFSPILELPTDEHQNWVELEIKSGVGTQEYDEFDFYAPEGITVESGVELRSESRQGKIKLEADSGDINIEEGVVFSTTDSATNDPEEIYIKTCGNVDIQGAQFDARRYIYIEAGGSINARDADLTVSTNSAQLGIDFVLNEECADIETGNIEVENLYMKFLNRDQQAEADPCEAIEGDLRDLSDNFDCP